MTIEPGVERGKMRVDIGFSLRLLLSRSLLAGEHAREGRIGIDSGSRRTITLQDTHLSATSAILSRSVRGRSWPEGAGRSHKRIDVCAATIARRATTTA